MSETAKFIEFAIDVVCVVPPISESETAFLSRDNALSALVFAAKCLGLIPALIAVMIFRTLPTDSNSMWRGIGILTGIVALMFSGSLLIRLFISDTAFDRNMIAIASVVMACSIRIGEGLLIGRKHRRTLRWWHMIAFACIVAAIYCLLAPMPSRVISIFKLIWALAASMYAAYILSSHFSEPSELFTEHFNQLVLTHPVFRLAIFPFFASSLLYVSAAPLAAAVYHVTFPVGVVLGARCFTRAHAPRTVA